MSTTVSGRNSSTVIGLLSPDARKSSCMLDWLHARPDVVSSGSRAFDMTSLKMEMPTCMRECCML